MVLSKNYLVHRSTAEAMETKIQHKPAEKRRINTQLRKETQREKNLLNDVMKKNTATQRLRGQAAKSYWPGKVLEKAPT